MKTLLSLAFVFILGLPLKAQKLKFVTEDGKAAKEEEAIYKRKVNRLKNGNWLMEDFYLSGQLQMSGQYLDKELYTKVDTFKWFHLNGQLQSEYVYKNNKPNGKFRRFYYNGQKKIEGTYQKGSAEGEWKEWHINGKVKRLYSYEDNLPTGDWYWYDYSGNETQSIKNATLLKIRNLKSYPKMLGDKNFSDYIGSMKYPFEVSIQGIYGLGFYEFAIDTTGTITEFEVVIPSDIRLDSAFYYHLTKAPKFSPATELGAKVKYYVQQELNYRMYGEKLSISDENIASYYYNSGVKAAENNEIDKAIRRLEYAKSRKLKDVDLLNLLGYLYLRKKDYEKSCDCWLRLHSFDPSILSPDRKAICNIKD